MSQLELISEIIHYFEHRSKCHNKNTCVASLYISLQLLAKNRQG